MNFIRNNFKSIILVSVILAVLIGSNFASATVGGRIILTNFYYSEKEKAAYFVEEDWSARGEETVYQYNLKTRELKKVLSHLEERENYEEKKLEIFLHATKSFYPINLKKNDIGIKLVAIKEEPAAASPLWLEWRSKPLRLKAIISQDGKEKGEVEFLVCTPGEKVNFDGLSIPDSDTILFVVTTIGSCFEAGYLVQKAFPLSGFEIKDPTALLFVKAIYPEEEVKPIYGGILMKSPLYIDEIEELEATIKALLQAQLKALMEKIKQLQELIAQLQSQTSKWCHNFNVNLRYGDTGDEVYALHIALEKEGFTIPDSEKIDIAHFGDHTASAVVGFQERHKKEILTPRGLKRGTGYVGPTTRNKLNKLYGCEVAPPVIKEEEYIPMLEQMFPGKIFIQTKNRKDCFFDETSRAQIGEVNSYDIYCIEELIENFFTNPDKKSLLLIVRFGSLYPIDSNRVVPRFKINQMPSNPHAMGIYHSFLGVFDIKNRKLLTEPLHLVADRGEIAFYDCKNKTHILFNGSLGGQGLLAYKTELFGVEEGKFERVWPEEEGWPGGYMKIEIKENRLSLYEYTPIFPIPDDLGKHLYDLFWNEETCRFEKKD